MIRSLLGLLLACGLLYALPLAVLAKLLHR